MIDIRKIIFEDIDDRFGYGMYGEFKIIISKKNSTINATKLTALGNKRFDHWLQSASNRELIEKIKEHIGEEVCINVNDVANHLRGTYVHRKLIVHIASWVSADFAIKVSDIVDKYIIGEYENLLKIKDTKIDELQFKIDKLLSDSSSIIKMNKLQLSKLDKQENKLDIIANSLDIATNRYVPSSQNNKKNEILMLVKNPNIEEIYDIHAIRCMYTEKNKLLLSYITTKIDKYNKTKIKNQKLKPLPVDNYVMFEINTPNSKNLWHRIKEDEELKNKISFLSNDLYIYDDNEFTNDNLFEEIVRINNKKKELYVNATDILSCDNDSMSPDCEF